MPRQLSRALRTDIVRVIDLAASRAGFARARRDMVRAELVSQVERHLALGELARRPPTSAEYGRARNRLKVLLQRLRALRAAEATLPRLARSALAGPRQYGIAHLSRDDAREALDLLDEASARAISQLSVRVPSGRPKERFADSVVNDLAAMWHQHGLRLAIGQRDLAPWPQFVEQIGRAHV